MPKEPVEIVVCTDEAITIGSTSDAKLIAATANVLLERENDSDDGEDNSFADESSDDDEQDAETVDSSRFLRPYKRLDSAPIINRVQQLRSLVKKIQSQGPNPLLFTDDEKKELQDHVDNFKYIAIAESHFPNHPSVLSEKETGLIALALEMTLSLRYAVVFSAVDFLALATKHPLCSREVLSATCDALVVADSSSSATEDEHQALNLKASVASLNLIARSMLKYKNKTELQVSALDLLLNLVGAKKTSNSKNKKYEQGGESTDDFIFPTLDILQSQAMSALLSTVSETQQKQNNDSHHNASMAEKVCKFFQLLIQQRPNLQLSSSPSSPEQQQQQQQEIPSQSTADLLAHVGDVLPALLRSGNQFYATRPRVAGPVCRILRLMAAANSHETLALYTPPRSVSSSPPTHSSQIPTPAALLGKILKHYSSTTIHSITLDCLRSLSQIANHFVLPLQLDSFVLLIRGVMTTNGNVEVLTTCIACLAHALTISEKNLEEKLASDENDQSSSTSIQAKDDMKKFLELLQKEVVPFVGAAYDHFADENEDLESIASAFLRSLGDRIRKKYYYSVPQ